MSMQSTTRSRGSATALPGPQPFGVLSRRAAMFGAFGFAGLGASLPTPAVAQAAIIGATSSVSADADLVAHAHRIVSLAQRCEAIADHRAGLEDQVVEVCPRPDPLPKPPICRNVTEIETPTTRLVTAALQFERDPAWVQWEVSTAAAEAAHERQEIETSVRLGLHS